MPTINQLPLLSSISSGDQLPVYSPNNGDARRTSVGSLLTFFQDSFAAPDLASQFVTPATGFNVTVTGTNPGTSVWLLLQPAGTLATGTVTLPLNTTAVDGQEVLITSTQIVTTLTVAGNGASAVNGAPSTIAANGFFRLRFYSATNSWYRIA